jgi:hypothetical protein
MSMNPHPGLRSAFRNDKRRFWDLPWVYMTFCVAALLLFIGAVQLIEQVPQRINCATAYDGVQTRYKFVGGCQVRVNGVWIPERRFRPQ